MSADAQAVVAAASKFSWRDFLFKYAIVLVLIGLVILMAVLTWGRSIAPRNLINIMQQMSMIAIIAVGAAFCMITGGIDLSPGSIVALAGVVAAINAHPDQHPLYVPILAGMAVGALAGLVNGVMISYGELPPFIATLGMMSAARGAAFLITDAKPVGDFTPQFEFIGGGKLFSIPMPIVILAFIAVIFHLLLNNTRFGLGVYSIGGNETAAMVSGIPVRKIKTIVYTLAGLLSGISAIILTSRMSSGQPGAGINYELDAIAAAVVGGVSQKGGVGTVPMALIGALIIGVLNNGFIILNVSPYWQLIVKGGIIVCAVLLDQRKNRIK